MSDGISFNTDLKHNRTCSSEHNEGPWVQNSFTLDTAKDSSQHFIYQ